VGTAIGVATFSVERLRGMLGGAIILTLFAAFWSIAALANWSTRPSWTIPAAVLTTIALLAASATRIGATRGIESLDDPIAEARGKRAGMWFGIIFGLEGGLIFLCSLVLAHVHLTDWIPIGIALIVGVHFFPLARVFEVPLYYGTGGLCVLGVLACTPIGDGGLRILFAGLTMAVVLWGSVVLILFQARAMTQSRNVAPAGSRM
jgi:hypothetical protein